MTLVDTHCHLDFTAYDGIRAEVIRRALDSGVTRIINPGTDLERSRAAVALADATPGIDAAVGIHPNSTADFTAALLDELRALAQHPRVVAIGEIGLDYHWDDSPKAMQWGAFEAQLALAAELQLPVIVHNRDASQDVLDILAAWTAALPDALKLRPGVLHSFSAPPEIAERGLALGFYLGFTGPGDLQESRWPAPDRRQRPGGSHPGRDGWSLPHPPPPSRPVPQRTGLRALHRGAAGGAARCLC